MENPESQNDELHFNNRIPLDNLKIAVESIKTQLGKIIIGKKNLLNCLLLVYWPTVMY